MRAALALTITLALAIAAARAALHHWPRWDEAATHYPDWETT